jgi:hypothetical protein
MGRRLVERRLRAITKRLRSLRDEIRVIDDQLAHLADDADDAGIRALVSETPGAGSEYRQAQAHADAMRAHRTHVLTTIADLEAKQDELLDQLSAAPD